MTSSEPIRPGRPLLVLLAVVFGLFLGEIAVLVARAPGLLQPGHWSGLGALLVSAVLLYIAAGIYFLLFYVMLRIMSFVFRLRLTAWATALVTVLTALPFLVLQHGLQERMLGKWMAPGNPHFYVPTLITLAILAAVLVLIGLAVRRAKGSPGWFRRVTDWRSLVAIAFVVFIAYASLSKVPINVLGLFPDEEERNAVSGPCGADDIVGYVCIWDEELCAGDYILFIDLFRFNLEVVWSVYRVRLGQRQRHYHVTAGDSG